MFGDVNVKQDLFAEARVSRPGITSVLKFAGDKAVGGFFAIDADKLGDGVVPGPFWEMSEHVFGNDPMAEATPIWKAQRLRCCIVGYRERQGWKDGDRQLHYYHQFTKPEARPETAAMKYASQLQIAVMVPGVAEFMSLALNGVTRSNCWENNEDQGRYYDSDYPLGIMDQIVAYTDKLNKQESESDDMPWQLTWWVDLVPLYKNGAPVWVNVNETFMNPITVDLSTADNMKLDGGSRYVGAEMFGLLQDIREDSVIPWEKEWTEMRGKQEGGDGESAGGYDDDSGPVADVVQEDDVIPF